MTPIPTVTGTEVVTRLLSLLETVDLTQASLDPETVHQIRVAIKQARAWLKLCRGVTGKTASHQQLISNLRALSASLAGQRDRDVALLTLAKLVRKYPGKKAQHLINELSRAIATSLPPGQATLPSPSELIAPIRQELVPFLQLAIPPATQQNLVKHTYGKMCQAGKDAMKSERCEDLHVWRKRVKTLGYQLVITGVTDVDSQKLLSRVTRLGSKLGNIHDLCFLQVLLEDMDVSSPHALPMAPVYKRIDKERAALLKTIRKYYRHVCQHPIQ